MCQILFQLTLLQFTTRQEKHFRMAPNSLFMNKQMDTVAGIAFYWMLFIQKICSFMIFHSIFKTCRWTFITILPEEKTLNLLVIKVLTWKRQKFMFMKNALCHQSSLWEKYSLDMVFGNNRLELTSKLKEGHNITLKDYF